MAFQRSLSGFMKPLLFATCALLLLSTFSMPTHAQAVSFAGAQTTIDSGLTSQYGVAVDSAGDVFIADSGDNRVVEIPAGGGAQTTVGSGLIFPTGVALDRAGDVFIADSGNNRVVEVPAGGGTQTTVLASGLSSPHGVAVDGAGDVFIADSYNSRVVEVPAGGGAQTTVLASGLSYPYGVAVDGAGDVFVADTFNGRVVEVPAGGGAQTAVGNGLSEPWGVAVDSAGDVFIADYDNVRVVEVPVGGGAQTTVASGLLSPLGVAVDGGGDVFIADDTRVVEVQRIAVNFGNANVCPGGQTIPAPCSQTFTLNYNVAVTTTFGAINVVTQGAPNLDFTLSSGSTCTGTVSAESVCAVNVEFAPLAPGARMGAVQLMDNSGNLLVTTMIHGVGQGPAIAFGPGVQAAVGSGVTAPYGVAVDGVGDVFIADHYNNRVVEVPAGGGTQITVPANGLNTPQGIAVDGAGDVFIADSNNNRVVEVAAGGGPQTTVGSGLNTPIGVAVDGAGDVFIADNNNNRVVQVPAGGGAQTTVGSGLLGPTGVAVDGAGDVFITDIYNNRVVEVPVGGGAQTTVGSGLLGPSGVAVDGAGDVFIAEVVGVMEVPAGGGAQTMVGPARSETSNVAVDGAGDVFITVYGNTPVVEVQRAQPPTFSFATSAVGSTSSDSPQSVTIQNVGNQPLNAVAAGLVVTGPNFVQVAGSGSPADCTSGFALTSGATCNLSISFEPQSAGPLTSTATFTDNALNTIPSASQSIGLQGTGTPVIQSQTITFTIPAPANAAYNNSFPVAATGGESGNPVVFTSAGSCSNVGSLYTMTSGTGTCSVIANQAGNSNYSAAAQVSQSVNATPLSQTIAFTVPAPATAKSGDTFTVAATPGASGNPVVFTSSGVCTNSGATYTMINNTGTCMVIANQAGNSNYAAATQITETVTAVTTVIKVTPTVTFTGAPGTAYYQSTFTVATTQNTGITPTVTAAGSCKISGTTVTMSSGTGTCTLAAKWATDAYYLATTVTEHTTAEKLASGLSWTPPAPINYGTALSVTELNATTNVPGKFVYTPASGKVLTAGTHTLSVTFTPTATADFGSATETGSLVVNQLSTTTAITTAIPNPSIMGKPVRVSFKVTATYGKPTGTVTVNSSSGETCTGNLSGGMGSCSLTFASSGSPTLTATYTGDTNDITSMSSGYTQTVNP